MVKAACAVATKEYKKKRAMNIGERIIKAIDDEPIDGGQEEEEKVAGDEEEGSKRERERKQVVIERTRRKGRQQQEKRKQNTTSKPSTNKRPLPSYLSGSFSLIAFKTELVLAMVALTSLELRTDGGVVKA